MVSQPLPKNLPMTGSVYRNNCCFVRRLTEDLDDEDPEEDVPIVLVVGTAVIFEAPAVIFSPRYPVPCSLPCVYVEFTPPWVHVVQVALSG